MRKHVYLFELDSVRKTDTEIIAGQKILYNEIVANGNIVVLTYNQLVDSRGFFSLLTNPDYYKNLIALFEKGAIRISQWGDIRTISQYLINAVDEDKAFIYSALPLKYSQKRLTALVRRSLIYSDLSEIHSYSCEGTRTEAQLRDLFREVYDGTDHETTLGVKQMRNIVENLYWLLSTVLRLSMLHDIYIPPRDEKEYQDLKLYDILTEVLSWEKRRTNSGKVQLRSFVGWNVTTKRTITVQFTRDRSKIASNCPQRTMEENKSINTRRQSSISATIMPVKSAFAISPNTIISEMGTAVLKKILWHGWRRTGTERQRRISDI